MSRIIAGTMRGRTFHVPRSGTRPTAERVREALFSALESRSAIRGAHVLDLYAGSGALGFESISRGATTLTAVEAARPAAQVIRTNARALGIRTNVVVAKTGTFLGRGISAVAGAPFHLVFLDPPYGIDVDDDLVQLADSDWLAEGAIVVVERASRSTPPTFPARFAHVTEKTYGDTRLWIAEAE
ncbi:MAG TPA: 16S rRNA (guanine(966)-N(2))-methyltransferase RsmD [Actinomycetaceae bacterium]|nr:16S rRNA (guanine(966)-N(2))-methyltransferase RsmD [Actinomycetaceae bacterium]